MYKYGYTPDLNTHSLKRTMWSALQIILIVIVASIAMLLYGTLAYGVYQHCYHHWTDRHPETHRLPGPHSAGSPIRFAHPVPSNTNNEEIELSVLSSTLQRSQPPHQSIHSCSSTTVDLEMMGLSVDQLTELPPARCSSATLDTIVPFPISH